MRGNHNFSLLMAKKEDCHTHMDSFTAHNSVAMSETMYIAKKRQQ
jgi:hypothetical protein